MIGKNRKCGQTMVEYVVVLSATVVLALVMGYLLKSVKSQANRTEALVSSEYP